MFCKKTLTVSENGIYGFAPHAIRNIVKRRLLWLIVLSVLLAGLPRFGSSAGQSVSPARVDEALSHIIAWMDRWHAGFDIYSEAGAAGNHFASLAKIADDFAAVDIDLCSEENPHSGLTAIRSAFRNTTGQNWGGWYFLNGLLSGDESQPRPNWGEAPDAGVDLRGATQLTFWARGARGGEKVEFFMGGVGRNPDDGSPVMPYPDSTARVPHLGTLFTLTSNWAAYTIDLSGVDLSYILGGFGWTCSAQNNPDGATFQVDDVQYNKPRPDAPRFIQSYVTLSDSAFDTVHLNVAFTYDNAIAMLALMSRGSEDDWRRAKLIANAFVYAQNNDPFYNDGRLRNAYQAGDLILPPGWTPNQKTAAVRLPSIINCAAGATSLDRIQVSSYTGNLAWAAIALLTYYGRMGGAEYLGAARRLGEWIEGRRQTSGFGGYRGGFEGFDKSSPQYPNDPVEVRWASAEHNLDVFVCFTRLFQATGEAVWRDRASHARAFIEKMWDPAVGCLLVGTKDAATLDRDLLTLDVQAWSVLAIDDALNRFPSVLQCAEARHRTTSDGFIGFDFNDDKDGVWFEGCAHMALAYQKTGQSSKADEILDQLRRAQATARNANGQGIVAASHDGVTTGFLGPDMERQFLYSRLHLGATAWYALAELGKNPYYLFGAGNPRISRVSVKGKKLTVEGEGFDDGAIILINGQAQKTSNDANNPTMKLIGKKAGKKIRPGDRVKVRNVDGAESNEVIYEPGAMSVDAR